MQEFFAAVYLCENKDQFERIIVPRYQTQCTHAYKVCIKELSQAFIFLCGLDVKLADKMSDLMNNQLRISIIEPGEFIGTEVDVFGLTSLVMQGVEEADNNDFPDVCLCMRYISLYVDNSQIMCNRLIQMNQLQLVSLTLKPNALANNVYLKGVALQHCPQLQQLMIYDAHLGNHELLLPVNIRRIALFDVTMTTLVLQRCTQLKKLVLCRVQLGTLMLPDNITHVVLIDVTCSSKLSKKLRLTTVNLVDQELRLPDNITSVDLYNVNLTAGFILQHCKQLQELTLGEANFGNQQLLLPASITNINMYAVIWTTGLSLQHCKRLQKLKLHGVDLSDHELVLPDNITSINVDYVTFAENLLPRHCSQLQKLELQHVNRCDLELPRPLTSITTDRDSVTLTAGLALQHFPQLKELFLGYLNLANHELLLPDSIASLSLDVVTMTGGLSLQHFAHLQSISLSYMKLQDNSIELPTSINSISLYKVTLSVRSVLALVEQVENLPNEATCKLFYCQVEPSNEHNLVQQRLKQTSKLCVDIYDPNEFTMKLHVRKT